MDHKQLSATLKKQRDALMVEPIHATFEPVRAYATQISTVKGVPHSVVTIPRVVRPTAWVIATLRFQTPNSIIT